MSITALAQRQWGLVTYGQAIRCGLSPEKIQRRVASGRWIRVRRGVYAVAGVPPSWEQAVTAAVLAAGAGAVASHGTAAALWGLPGFERGDLEITTDRPDQRRLPGVRTHRTSVFLRAEHTIRRGIPMTSVARTLADVSARRTVAQLGAAADAAIREGSLGLHDLRLCVDGLRPAPGRHLRTMNSVGARRLPGYEAGESGLQMRFARGLVAAGCPEPTIEHRVRAGGKRYRIDLAYTDVMLAIEVDGWDVHRTRTAFDRDRARANDLVAAGWTLLRLTASMSDTEAAHVTRSTLVRLASHGDAKRTNAPGSPDVPGMHGVRGSERVA
ncbi:MAG TPA: type IV toxin-antitoxin system AbiEi family antitoxin domain-containing protein [Acidimicrobiia bacterium]|nr:type IV toxin-antitoxin system AbiEi family antitoxin domain-containing protein [Acidimicrobiia bacterium]